MCRMYTYIYIYIYIYHLTVPPAIFTTSCLPKDLFRKDSLGPAPSKADVNHLLRTLG